ncbi:MAG: DNA mismatch repair endonuclease MutL, partial [Armatimonadota bacterium]
ESGGRSLICVADNGCGMTREEALLSLQRHATSKIRSAEDLMRVTTLGFRGEALPSIAAVSRLQLFTRTHDSVSGTHIEVEAGAVKSVEEAGVPPGTRVEVRDLFYNTPARLKFIKSDQTELGHIVELVGKLAMAHHQVSVRLLHNGREVFATPGSPDARAAMAAVWGSERASRTVPILYETQDVKVTGFAASPEVSRPNRAYEAFFVNRRPISSRLLSHALEEAYRTLIPDGRYPVAAVFLEMDPELVDVNVHPTKAEVRFKYERDVHQAVVQAVRLALLGGRQSQRVGLRPSRTVRNGGGVGAAQFLPSSIAPRPQGLPQVPVLPNIRLGISVDEVRPPASEGEFDAEDTSWRLIGQIAGTFIVGEAPDGMVIIDQHVAHERVIYDRLKRGITDGSLEVQRLLLPVTVTLGPQEAAAVSAHLEEINRAGFEVEPFGGGTFLLRAVPAVTASSSPEAILSDLASEMAALDGTGTAAKEGVLDAVITTAACKGAVKAGQALSPAEMRKLVQDLLDSENPLTCPHGRPIIVKISHQELLKWFKRA